MCARANAPVLQALEVAQHFMLTVVHVKDGRLQVGGGPLEATHWAVSLHTVMPRVTAMPAGLQRIVPAVLSSAGRSSRTRSDSKAGLIWEGGMITGDVRRRSPQPNTLR